MENTLTFCPFSPPFSRVGVVLVPRVISSSSCHFCRSPRRLTSGSSRKKLARAWCICGRAKRKDSQRLILLFHSSECSFFLHQIKLTIVSLLVLVCLQSQVEETNIKAPKGGGTAAEQDVDFNWERVPAVVRDIPDFNWLEMARNSKRMVKTFMDRLQCWRGECDLQLLIYDSGYKDPDLTEIAEVTDYVVGCACKGNTTLRVKNDMIKEVIMRQVNRRHSAPPTTTVQQWNCLFKVLFSNHSQFASAFKLQL